MAGVSAAAKWPGMNNELFVENCRRRGTRIDAIMTMIEGGATDRQVADKFGTQPKTIRVYRKALMGELSTGLITPTTKIRERDAVDEATIEMFRSSGADVLKTDYVIFTDPDRLLEMAFQASGAKNKAQALKFIDYSRYGWWHMMSHRHMATARRALEVSRKLGVNLYEAGLVAIADD